MAERTGLPGVNHGTLGRRNSGRQRLAPEIERAIWDAEQRRLAHLQAAKALTRERIADTLGIAKRTVAKALRRMERERRGNRP